MSVPSSTCSLKTQEQSRKRGRLYKGSEIQRSGRIRVANCLLNMTEPPYS